MPYNPNIRPGEFELYEGPMRGNKTGKLLERIDLASHIPHCGVLAFKPTEDTRDPWVLKSAAGDRTFPAVMFNGDNPGEIYDLLARGVGGLIDHLTTVIEGHSTTTTDGRSFEYLRGTTLQLLVFDELELVHSPSIVDVILDLTQRDYHVLGGGLGLDFTGAQFNHMPHLLAVADRVEKVFGICDYDGCRLPSKRTQRFLNGDPAPFTDPLIVPEQKGVQTAGDVRTYETRCVEHHEVPGKPENIFAERDLKKLET